MKASELIILLADAIKHHGDLPVTGYLDGESPPKSVLPLNSKGEDIERRPRAKAVGLFITI